MDVPPPASARSTPAQSGLLSLLERFALKERERALRRALAVLSAPEREAIEAAYFAGLTHAEAATRLAQPLGTVKTRIRSALHKLRDELGGEADR